MKIVSILAGSVYLKYNYVQYHNTTNVGLVI
jgi:hypothetical protein